MNLKIRVLVIIIRQGKQFENSQVKMLRRILNIDGKYDLIFFFIFTLQTSTLASIPSGFHSAKSEGWLGFVVTLVFDLIFYTSYYYYFYRSQYVNFIREVVVLSVVSRLLSFIITGIFAVIQIGVSSLLGLNQLSETSLIYYLFYYSLFAYLMVHFKKNLDT